jgi:hypothetical protein
MTGEKARQATVACCGVCLPRERTSGKHEAEATGFRL